jgi:hypothetical protein
MTCLLLRQPPFETLIVCSTSLSTWSRRSKVGGSPKIISCIFR